MKISLIAAIAREGAIGRNGNLLCHLSEDLKRFKKLTLGHHVIMGRKTYESIGRPLPGRVNVIITRDKDFKDRIGSHPLCRCVQSIEEALEAVRADKNPETTSPEEPFVIGGGEIYRQFLEQGLIDDLYITHLDLTAKDADTFLKIDYSKWEKVENEDFRTREPNQPAYSFTHYKRRA